MASSLQAPILFVIADDLKQMELKAAIDEADIGSVAVGQDASFTVDAFPDRSFHAEIRDIVLRLADHRRRRDLRCACSMSTMPSSCCGPA